MKNLNSILLKGSFKERALLYFENLGIESIKEGTAEAGFLSELEEANLLYSFDNKQDYKDFKKCNKVYNRIMETLNKVQILKMSFEVSAECYSWIKITFQSSNDILDTINQFVFDKKMVLEGELNKRVIMGTLQIKEGFFEIESTPEMDFVKYLPIIKQATIDKLIKVKSAIHAVRCYMNEQDFTIQTHQKLLNLVEEESIKLCADLDTDYSKVEIDEGYSNWFSGYFLS